MDYKEYADFCNKPEIQEHLQEYPELGEKVAVQLAALKMELPKVSEIKEKDAKWILPGCIPRGQITCLAGDGGVGKTFLWCTILGALSKNTLPGFMYPDFPFTVSDEDKERPFIMFSGEDSTAVVLKKRLKRIGADENRILSLGVEDERFQSLKFGSDFTEDLIAKYRPLVCVFDPVQSFIPEHLRMAERNAMRSCTQNLVRIGEKYDCTFIIVVHTNKRPGAYGRKRMSDSSDLWDSARSVLIAGETSEKGICYIAHEKSNYGEKFHTVLYQIQKGVVVHRGFTDKTDRDFVKELEQTTMTTRAAPARDEAVKAIKEILKNGEMSVRDLEQSVQALGVTSKTMRNAKEYLKETGEIIFRCESRGKNKGVEWFVHLSGQYESQDES